jgi:hypothetical protein
MAGGKTGAGKASYWGYEAQRKGDGSRACCLSSTVAIKKPPKRKLRGFQGPSTRYLVAEAVSQRMNSGAGAP